MSEYVIQFNSNPKTYLFIENPTEKFYLKMKCHAVLEIEKASRFESVSEASHVCETHTFEKKKGHVIKL